MNLYWYTITYIVLKFCNNKVSVEILLQNITERTMHHCYISVSADCSDCKGRNSLASSVDPEQTAPQEQSDLGPHCLQFQGLFQAPVESKINFVRFQDKNIN